MRPHVARAEQVALWIAFLLGLAALLGGLQTLVGILRGHREVGPNGKPKYDTGSAVLGIAVGSLFIWISMIYGMPQKRAEAVEAQREELREWLSSNAATMPVDTFLAYVRVGAVGIDEGFGNGSALLQYVEAGDVTAARRLLDAGAHVDSHSSGERTPLLAAVDDDDVQLVRLLLAAHANPNLAADNLPIFDAVDPAGDTQPANADPGETEGAPRKNDGHIYTADRQEIVSALAAAGADLNVRDERSYTPLMVAAATGQCDLVAALVLAHADRSLQVNTGETALDWSQSEDHPQCVPLLTGSAGSYAAAQALVATTAMQHPPRLSGDKHLEGTQSEFQKRLAAQKAEAAKTAKEDQPFGWLRKLFGNGLLSLVLTLIVSSLWYFGRRIWHFLRRDHRLVRWVWVPISVNGSSAISDESSGENSEPSSPSRGGASGGAGASGDF